MIVVDASALVQLLLSGRASGAFQRLSRASVWNAPVTIDAELLHALRRQWLAEKISDEHVDDAIAAFQEMAIVRHAVHPLVPRMWALRRNVTSYDAAYITLAESLNLPLVTRDARLARSSGHAAAVELIE